MSSIRIYFIELFSSSWKWVLFLYSFLLAILILFLKFSEYKFLVRQLQTEVYMGLVAALFTGVGVWAGLKIVRKKDVQLTNKLESHRQLGISKREYQVLQLMAKGLSNQQIAEQLFISLPTVKTHSSNLYIKLNVKRRTQAIHKAKHLKLIE